MNEIKRYYNRTEYLQDGEQHRTDGPAIEWDDGSKAWWQDGKCHRTDGPAVERANGNKSWYIDGKRHRTNGPAIEWADGTKEWYVNGSELTEDEFNDYLFGNRFDDAMGVI